MGNKQATKLLREYHTALFEDVVDEHLRVFKKIIQQSKDKSEQVTAKSGNEYAANFAEHHGSLMNNMFKVFDADRSGTIELKECRALAKIALEVLRQCIPPLMGVSMREFCKVLSTTWDSKQIDTCVKFVIKDAEKEFQKMIERSDDLAENMFSTFSVDSVTLQDFKENYFKAITKATGYYLAQPITILLKHYRVFQAKYSKQPKSKGNPK